MRGWVIDDATNFPGLFLCGPETPDAAGTASNFGRTYTNYVGAEQIYMYFRFVAPLLPRCMQCRRRLAMRKLSFLLSVCPSVCQTRGLWHNGRKIGPLFIPYERSFSLVFWEKEWLVEATPSTWILGQPAPVGPKSPILNGYLLVVPQP